MIALTVPGKSPCPWIAPHPDRALVRGYAVRSDQVLLSLIAEEVLQPDTLRLALDEATTLLLTRPDETDRRTELEQAVLTIDAEVARLTSAIATGGAELTPLLEGIRSRRERRTQLLEAIATTTRVVPAQLSDRDSIERELLQRLSDWKGFLGRQTVWSRQILTKLLAGRITFTPTTEPETGAPAYEIRVPLTFDRFFAGLLCPQRVASPAGTDTLWTFERRRLVRAA